MYWPGTVYGSIKVSGSAESILIRVKGSSAYGIWPYMIVHLDGKKIGTSFVNSEEFKEYLYPIDSQQKGKTVILRISFANDGGNDVVGEDRNLYVDQAKVVPATQ